MHTPVPFGKRYIVKHHHDTIPKAMKLISTFNLQDWSGQSPTQIVTEMCGFVTILAGTFLLHKTKDMVDGMVSASLVQS